MDDGGWAKPSVRIATNSFNLEKVQFLAQVIRNKFSLDCTVQLKANHKHSIYIKGSSVSTLRNIVLPHLHPTLYHKFGL